MRPTKHQQRILAAVLALESRHGLRWWSTYPMGTVIGVTVQKYSLKILERMGLVQTEASSWPSEVRNLVRCPCAWMAWGLTTAGRTAAEALAVRWSHRSLNCIERAHGKVVLE